MHLPIVWQWFPACKDFSVSLQASCKRRNQRQPRPATRLPNDRLVWSAEPYSAPETQLNIAGSSKVPSREVRQANREACHRKLPDCGKHGPQWRISSMGPAADRRPITATLPSFAIQQVRRFPSMFVNANTGLFCANASGNSGSICWQCPKVPHAAKGE